MPRCHRELPDEDLMLAYAQGDAAAFDALYARHEAGRLRYSLKKLRGCMGAYLVALEPAP